MLILGEMELEMHTAKVVIAFIPIVGILIGGFVLAYFIYWHYKQKLLIIEKGLYREKKFDFAFYSFFAGLVSTGTGFALTLFFIISSGFSSSVLAGLIPLSVGISLILFYVLMHKKLTKR